jgi:dienelactone hydrolase
VSIRRKANGDGGKKEYRVRGRGRRDVARWLFVPGAKGPAPAITMAHGYAGVKEHGMERFARAFAEAGFVVLVHDHRRFGASDGGVYSTGASEESAWEFP